MKLLFIHADYMEYEARQPTKFAESILDEVKKGRMEEVLVAFTAIEKQDEKDPLGSAEAAANEISEVAKKVKTDNVMLYAYAHLSPSLANPDKALEIFKDIEIKLKEQELNVHRSPFGWYKSFNISCKGHPLSELSRSVELEEKAVTREEVVEKIESEYYVLTPEGEEFKFHPEDVESLEVLDRYPTLKAFVMAEEVKGQPKGEPPSIKEMKRLELIDHEDASDSGHFKFFPKGALIFDLLREWATYVATEKIGAIQIETPILYDWSLPDIKGQTASFHERHYTIETEEGKELVLRFAGDFGLFRMMKNATMSYKQLPIRVYEFSKSFRYEQRGELSGLKRLRGFHMPDIHCFAKDLEQGWDEFQWIHRNYSDHADGTGVEWTIGFRIVKEFYENHKDKIIEMLKYSKRPALIETLSEAKHYWVVKNELQAVDSVGGNCQLGTVQLDVEDAERYGITYYDEKGEAKGCIISHSSIGSIERWIYAILEEALKKEKPELPLWLAPTQIRFVPVSQDFVEDCAELAASLKARVDVDDRDDSVGRKIREAEREWVNMIIVYGQKEKDGDTLPVRIRSGEVKDLPLDEIQLIVEKELRNRPYKGLPLPMLLSKRIVFRG
jgi:threonyl-tRNA synthetase